MNNLDEASLEEALVEMKRRSDDALGRMFISPTKMMIPAPVVQWLDENAPSGWRDRIHAMLPGDDIIAAIWPKS